jgi:flagellin-like hook-associated protein FlgL
MNFLLQSMRNQPGTAMAAQANQLSENVLSLLQSTD